LISSLCIKILFFLSTGGVSRTLITFLNRGSWIISLRALSPILPLPIFSCLSLCESKSFLESLIWRTSNFSTKPSSLTFLLKALLIVTSKPESHKWQVSKHTPYLTEEQNLASFKKIGSALGGKKGKEYPGLIGTNPQAERAKQNLAMRLPELDIERKELLAKTNTAEAAMVASQTKNVPPRTEYVGKKIMQIDEPKGGRQYDKDTRVWGPPSVISPSAIPDKVGYVDRRQVDVDDVIDDEWVQGAIDDNYAEDTQE